MAKIKMEFKGLKFDLEGVKNSPFFEKSIEAEGKISASLESFSVEAEASIEEMITEVIPQIKDVIKASIENKKK